MAESDTEIPNNETAKIENALKASSANSDSIIRPNALEDFAGQENIIDKLEKINFHRNQKEVEEITKLKFFENKRDYLIKLKDNILSKDFSILGEAPKEDMMKMKKDLYIESIKESK